ncbi:universal stress protein [Anaeromyxobacter sp. Fw109-5]|jgi:nucleotide-binding universal stress UspA family protein|uniref:universal stress protein n=1 Tax=Anaeromyxobacter sp. (strain Fw109-5) TaxID=404589 RepID=UPI000158A874|nr:universal stress protein [Anaeromyxobacter sp. Fw109-5]ABS28265.1 UspA domain protein [Anaeromyxobacter sp. Fw109-5]
MAIFKHVLAATDFSETSGRALETAVAIAREAGAELSVVHVCEIPPYTDFASPVDLVTPITDVAETKLEQLLSSIRDVCPAAKGYVRVGAPWEQLLATAAERGADLVVVGTHGRRGFAHAMMGSVAERVVRLSPVPVLTVRSRIPG